VIEKGAGLLNMELTQVIDWTIMGMRPVADRLGLAGNLES
jgi:hypothetical protein